MQQLSLAFNSINFQVRRSSRAKKLRVSITPVGNIEVVVPHNASTEDAEQFLQRQKSWIIDKTAQIAAMRSTELNESLPAFVDLPAIGEQWPVTYHQGASSFIREKSDRWGEAGLYVTLKNELDTPDLLKKWLTKKARVSLLPWLKRVSQQTGMRYSGASIRGQKTRWGSCSSRKNISLNRCMLFLEPDQVQYLLVHELCHTREMNHSYRFWRLVEQFVPDYREKECLVNEACYKLPRWAY